MAKFIRCLTVAFKKERLDCNATSGCGGALLVRYARSLLSEHCVLKAIQPAQVKAPRQSARHAGTWMREPIGIVRDLIHIYLD